MKRKKSNQFSLANQTFKYWEVFLSWLFKYSSRCYKLEVTQAAKIFENSCDALYRLGKSYRASSTSKGLICQVTDHPSHVDQTCAVLEEMQASIQNEELCELATAEILAKVLAYREMSEGQSLIIPVMQKDGKIKMTSYRVETVFDLWNKLRAFGLTSKDPSSPPSILLFRGTELSFFTQRGRASMISDLDPKGPGKAVFDKAEPTLHEWLQDQGKNKTRLIGHSLGGAIVTYTLLHESPFITHAPHARSYAFNFPGISKELLNQWENLPLEKKTSFQGIVCRGDVVSKFGNLFGNVYEISLPHTLSPISAHELLFFAQPLCYLHPVNIAKENASSSRSFYSKMQQQTSCLIYEFGLKFLFP